MLGVVWDNSSDVIGISVRGVSGDVTTMISPTYKKVYYDKSDDTNKNHDEGGKALAFDLDARCVSSGTMEDILPANVYDLDFQDLSRSGRPHKRERSHALEKEELASMAKLVVRAWKEGSPKSLIMHDLVRRNGSPRINIRCEANITRLEENALILVIRDISERFRRFEAEKKVISETTARIKDAAANRFTRHEVKNGLLAAIGLCDSLNESFEDLIRSGAEVGSKQGAETNVSDVAVKRYLVELDKTLHEILDTILAEAMARDVIHEVYEPKMEKVDILDLLNDSMNMNANKSHALRFPIESSPSPLPKFALDPQLLKYIHRNAISNACKYGKKSGIVTTFVQYNEEKSQLRMEVTNLPGHLHSEILKLGALAEEVVFSPRRRLAMHCREDQDNRFSSSHSSGDGAWIMKQCAKTLGGQCGIKFEPDKTVFSFSCPVKVFDEQLANSNIKYEDFALPMNLHAIAIDDSKIQRKLLSKFFSFAGIPEERIHILGEGVEEITGFCDWAISFVNEHPDEYILMVVDENLEVQEEQGGTKHTMVSGSRSVAEMRSRLLKDQERKILALIRSANDSASDVALYNSRAHGYLPKTPVKKHQVLEVLAPLWLSRFPQFIPLKTGRAMNDYEEAVIVTVDDMMVLIDEIDKYSLLPPVDLTEKWQIVVEKLHALRGDLLIMPNRGHVLNTAIASLGDLRESTPPQNFAGIWKSIRSILLDRY
jgi:signal transduction histidine kinase